MPENFTEGIGFQRLIKFTEKIGFTGPVSLQVLPIKVFPGANEPK